MRRIPWSSLFALLTGLGLGLVYAWNISPARVTDAQPSVLRADFKDHYRSAIAAAYGATGDLARAQARLSLLGDSDSIEALNAQAQRMLAINTSGESFDEADQVVTLASALNQNAVNIPTAITTAPSAANTPEPVDTAIVVVTINAATSTFPASTSEVPAEPTETPLTIETQTTSIAATPRPTRTFIPTAGAPFTLTGQESVCDPNLPDGLLQVLVFNSNRRQMPGIEILITWEGGAENFFTGLKPELGNGYADYIMSPDLIYTLQLRSGSDIASGLSLPTCQTTGGETFSGGIKLTFQEP
ncbi:MAG TPA: hypothetical protein VFD54_00315 [Anaerolineales bacterium]|nr:hypothetical protein [Anaerolineales bacterium]